MRKKQLTLILFLLAQLYLYVMIVCFNSYINSDVLVIISSLLCFILGIFLYCKSKDYYIMITSLFFTLLSDIFLITFEKIKVIGLIFINIVQILYFLRIFIDSESKKSNLISRIITIPLGVVICNLLLKEKCDINAILWVIYIINLFINILFTIKEIGINNFFPIGLIFLFVYASITMFVELENYLDINISFINFFNDLSFDIRLVFYIPAQIILTCSIFTVNRRNYSLIKKDGN